MALINTTDIIDSSVFLKAKLKKNMVSDNYYIENLQYRRDADWKMRYNVVDIEEELVKQIDYTSESPNYTPIEVVIRSVKDEDGEDLGTDWASISFQDLKHYNAIGSRYRFSLDFPDMSLMTDEEKLYNTCIWLAINKSPISPGNSCMIRRCNGNIALQGSPTNSYDNITEIRYEPVVLDNDLKYINLYYNSTLVVPQAEWYATMQMNYFTNSIKINDRFIFGGVDIQDSMNNSVYKVKAIVKASSTQTFAPEGSTEINSIPLIIIAMDKDVLGGDDKLDTRVPEQAPIYYVNEQISTEDVHIDIQPTTNATVLIGDTQEFTPELVVNGEKVNGYEFSYDLSLFNTITGETDTESNVDDYCVFSSSFEEGINKFYVKNIQRYGRGNLTVSVNINFDGMDVQNNYPIILGGFY